MGKDDGEKLSRNINSDYPTEESKKKFIRESVKIDENEILNKDEKLKEEVIKMFQDNFSALVLNNNHYGKTDLVKLKIDLEPGTVPKRSKVSPLNPDQKRNLIDRRVDRARCHRTC